ncbi:MAG: MlaD family protein [Planctomycetaceae bacterium]|jgi:phospholipid/cholesterol/gamma-HCH transport system substrate-binding protein|nr:MlaD family protein [Planctomycetaceae bacterium]
MEERRAIEFRIGIVVIVTIAVLVVFIVLFGPQQLPILSGDYKMSVIFEYAPMIQPNSPVSKNGVEIGRVSSLELVDNDRSVKVVLLIHKDVKIYTDEECRIESNLMGVTAISFQKDRVKSFEEAKVIPPNSTIHGFSPPNIAAIAGSLENRLSEALDSFAGAVKEITKSFAGINMLIGTPEDVAVKQQRLEKMVDTAMQTMVSIDKLSGGLESLINDPDIQHNLRTTAKDAPKLLGEVQLLMQNAREMIGDVRSIMRRMETTFTKVDGNLDNAGKFIESLGSDGADFFTRLKEVAGRLDTTMEEIEKFAAAFNNPDGSVQQLLGDPEFFNGLRRTAGNIEEITLQVKPVLSDIRVFSDKIARDPAVLGVKGVISKSPPIKGTPDTNIGYIGSHGEFPEPKPQFQVASLPQWRLCPQQDRLSYKYVIPERASAGYEAEYYEFPAAPATPLAIPPAALPTRPLSMPQPVFLPEEVPVLKTQERNGAASAIPVTVPSMPPSLELDFTPAQSHLTAVSPVRRHLQVTPLPQSETVKPVPDFTASDLRRQQFILDFEPAK